ncbi:MAG: polysaccharide deacetylase [Ruminiclostridium sp.]|nr:polysaccharide deacetylase [Ruminiclostridium sp.]
MYFGSVRFFKHLILTVVALLIIVPNVLCIILLCDNNSKSAEIDRLNSIIASEEYKSDTTDTSSVTESSDNSDNGNTDNKTSSEASATEETESVPTPEETESSVPETTTEEPETSAPETTTEEPETSAPETTTEEPETSAPETTTEEPETSAPETTTEEPETSVPEEQEDLTLLYDDMYVTPYTGEYINDDNTVYLTFDDGPSALTENILMYLRQENVKATFFVVPEDTEYCRILLRKIANDGHTIGIHTASHDYEAIYSSPKAFLEDFYKAYSLVYEATGIKADIYRFAGGSINDYNEDTREDIIAEMSRRGFQYFDWNVDSNDWQGYNWTQLYNSVLEDSLELSTPVILFHDTGMRENTVLVIEDIIKALKNKGYQFGSLSQKTEPIQFG